MEQEERKARRNLSNSRRSWNISSLYERILAVAQRHPTNMENKENRELPYPSSHWAILFQQHWAHFCALSQLFLLWDEDNKFYLFQTGAVTITWKYCEISHATLTKKKIKITLDIIAFRGFDFIHQIIGTPFGYFFREHFLIVRQVLFKNRCFESHTHTICIQARAQNRILNKRPHSSM